MYYDRQIIADVLECLISEVEDELKLCKNYMDGERRYPGLELPYYFPRTLVLSRCVDRLYCKYGSIVVDCVNEITYSCPGLVGWGDELQKRMCYAEVFAILEYFKKMYKEING